LLPPRGLVKIDSFGFGGCGWLGFSGGGLITPVQSAKFVASLASRTAVNLFPITLRLNYRTRPSGEARSRRRRAHPPFSPKTLKDLRECLF